MALSSVLRQLTRLFLATVCPICDRSAAEMLCPNCYRQVLECQWQSPTKSHVTRPNLPASYSTSELPVFAWGEYRGVLKQALALLKYQNHAELGFWLGCQLGKSWQARVRLPARPVVMPIPLHRQRLQQRGYNQAALIARGFCRATGLSLAESGLVRIRSTQAMHGLGIDARQANLRGAFQLGPRRPPKGTRILLVDDIYTTGSTAHAAAAILTQGGYTMTGITTVARAVFALPTVE